MIEQLQKRYKKPNPNKAYRHFNNWKIHTN